MKLLLDAGHGGRDPGAAAGGLKESDIALRIVLAAGRMLRETEGFYVLYTRDRDNYISPSDRLNMISAYRPDAFISIHCNAAANPDAHGIETLYRDEYDKPLAQAMHKALVSVEQLKDRGIKNDAVDLKRHLAVLGNLKVPACLCEIGFISNAADLHTITNYALVVKAIVEGVKAWQGKS